MIGKQTYWYAICDVNEFHRLGVAEMPEQGFFSEEDVVKGMKVSGWVMQKGDES